MFTVHHGNRLEVLADQLAALVGQPTNSPFIPDTIIVQSLGMARWLSFRLALALLEVPAIQRRFSFTNGDLAVVRRWLQATGVCWGIDHESRAALGLPAMREHTWRAGLDRLLAGYALPGGNSGVFAEILPYDAVEGVEAQVVGRLHTFTEAVFGLVTTLCDRRPVQEWIHTLTDLIEGFFAPDEREERDVQATRQALSQIGLDAAQAGFDRPVSLDVLTSGLRRLVEMPRWPGRFLTGGITCCALVPMRSIPFEVVCLIGMNDATFPRARRSLSFDRMAQDVRRGDRLRRDDDRYLFLEALLSARRCLYISYVGRHIRENSILRDGVAGSAHPGRHLHQCRDRRAARQSANAPRQRLRHLPPRELRGPVRQTVVRTLCTPAADDAASR